MGATDAAVHPKRTCAVAAVSRRSSTPAFRFRSAPSGQSVPRHGSGTREPRCGQRSRLSRVECAARRSRARDGDVLRLRVRRDRLRRACAHDEEEYGRLRSDPTTFAVRPGHAKPDVEEVVASYAAYDVVRKKEGLPAPARTGDRRMTEQLTGREAQLALNEATFREANERVGAVARRLDIEQPIPFICECGRQGCTTVIRVRPERLRAGAFAPDILPLRAGARPWASALPSCRGARRQRHRREAQRRRRDRARDRPATLRTRLNARRAAFARRRARSGKPHRRPMG